MVLTQEKVRELFDYREDGNLIWMVSTSRRIKVGDVAGSPNGDGYLRVGVNGEQYLAHRLIWLWHHGYLPENGLDHKDRIKTHNWIDNLREINRSCNKRNTANPINNSSGVKGVSWHKFTGTWVAVIKVHMKNHNLGYFSDFTEAVAHRLAHEQAVNWSSCDSSSPAYQFIKNYLSHLGRTL